MSSIRPEIDFLKSNKVLEKKLNALYLWTSSRGQVLSSTVAEKEIDCSTQNNSIMKTDQEGKFVSFKVVLGGTPLFKMNHGAVSMPGLSLLLERWSSQGTHHGEFRDMFPRRNIPKFFFVIAFVGSFKALTLTEKKELDVPPSLDHSLAYVRSLRR